MPPLNETGSVVRKLDEILVELKETNTHLQEIKGLVASQV